MEIQGDNCLNYEPQKGIPHDMQNAIRYAIEVAYEMAIHITIG
ncbi:MAG: hypothetical protein QXY52_05935 [Conexivisphaerales archaeon]